MAATKRSLNQISSHNVIEFIKSIMDHEAMARDPGHSVMLEGWTPERVCEHFAHSGLLNVDTISPDTVRRLMVEMYGPSKSKREYLSNAALHAELRALQTSHLELERRHKSLVARVEKLENPGFGSALRVAKS